MPMKGTFGRVQETPDLQFTPNHIIVEMKPFMIGQNY